MSDNKYESLGPERFQQFCQALLVNIYPDVQCLPIGQPDGGRDAFVRAAKASSRQRLSSKVRENPRPYSGSLQMG
jgi:hypothetical protein